MTACRGWGFRGPDERLAGGGSAAGQPDRREPTRVRAAAQRHFQGFCRDLYTQCALIVVSKVRPSLQVLVQSQFTAHRALDHGNPNLNNIRLDFERFGFILDIGVLTRPTQRT